MAIRNLNLEINDAPKLVVNGNIFELQISDHELMAMSANLQKKYRSMNAETPNDEVLAAVAEVVEGIDRILGEGAVAKIANGKPVSIVTAVRWLRLITQEAMEAYAEELAAQYE